MKPKISLAPLVVLMVLAWPHLAVAATEKEGLASVIIENNKFKGRMRIELIGECELVFYGEKERESGGWIDVFRFPLSEVTVSHDELYKKEYKIMIEGGFAERVKTGEWRHRDSVSVPFTNGPHVLSAFRQLVDMCKRSNQ